MSVVVSANWCIADCSGDVSFSSIEDKEFLKKLMCSDKSDCFVVGKTTYQMMLGEINKPHVILSRSKHTNQNNRIFANFINLLNVLDKHNLRKPLILGGNKIYLQFLQGDFVLEIYVVVEKNVILKDGTPFCVSKKNLGKLMDKTELSKNTVLLTYKRY